MSNNQPLILEKSIRDGFLQEIESYKTFRTNGVSKDEVSRYLDSPDGVRYQDLLSEARPSLSPERIAEEANIHIQSGRTLPTIEVINEPLVKIVKPGAGVSPHTPYFAKLSDLEALIESGESLSNKLGLPIASESPHYDVYVIRPKGPVEVFVSEIAPTSELDGRVQKEGGARPYRAPRRRHLLDDGMTTC